MTAARPAASRAASDRGRRRWPPTGRKHLGQNASVQHRRLTWSRAAVEWAVIAAALAAIALWLVPYSFGQGAVEGFVELAVLILGATAGGVALMAAWQCWCTLRPPRDGVR